MTLKTKIMKYGSYGQLYITVYPNKFEYKKCTGSASKIMCIPFGNYSSSMDISTQVFGDISKTRPPFEIKIFMG